MITTKQRIVCGMVFTWPIVTLVVVLHSACNVSAWASLGFVVGAWFIGLAEGLTKAALSERNR